MTKKQRNILVSLVIVLAIYAMSIVGFTQNSTYTVTNGKVVVPARVLSASELQQRTEEMKQDSSMQARRLKMQQDMYNAKCAELAKWRSLCKGVKK